MKRIKNMRQYFIGVTAMIIAGICLLVWSYGGQQTQFLIAFVVMLGYAFWSYRQSITKQGLSESIAETADERDRHIVWKSGHTTVQMLNYLLSSSCLICFVLYGVSANIVFMIIGGTLCATLVVLFVVMLSTKIYYERHS